MSWTVDDVQEWLGGIGVAEYKEKFLSKGIDGPQLMELDNKYYSLSSYWRKRLVKFYTLSNLLVFQNVIGIGRGSPGAQEECTESFRSPYV